MIANNISINIPEWDLSNECFQCNKKFTFSLRRHHCRYCGHSFCSNCQKKKSKIPIYGINKPVRVCDTCYNNIDHKSDNIHNESKAEDIVEKDSNIIVIGGSCNRREINSSCEIFDFDNQKWTINKNSINFKRQGFGTCYYKNKIYIFGGDNLVDNLDSIECLKDNDSQWTVLNSKMTSPRSYFAYSNIKNKFYTMGGKDKTNILSTFECFNIDSGEWISLSDLNNRRMCCSSTYVKKDNNFLLFCIGGKDENIFFNSVEYFDFNNNIWKFITPMLNHRSDFSSTSTISSIYVFGGRCYDNHIKECECYDIIEDKWYPISSLSTNRSGNCSVLYKDRIIISGGYNGDYLDSIECYDYQKYNWSLVGQMNIKREHGCLLIVDN